MIITKEIDIVLNSANMKWLEEKGYVLPKTINSRGHLTIKRGTTIKVKIEDLTVRGTSYVEANCDNPNCPEHNKIVNVLWSNYKRIHNGITLEYYCQKCAVLLFGVEKTVKTKLDKSFSFEEWCYRNNEEKTLGRCDKSKNEKLPSEISWSANIDYWFYCENGIHESELHNINKFTSNEDRTCNCRECNPYTYSRGEIRVAEYLLDRNIINVPQKSYKGLVGTGNGLLSYDFHLPEYNLLLEFQGDQHKKFTKRFHRTPEGFDKQIEHDRRKKQYCIDNDINLLEIWHKDFDNIELILDKYLQIENNII